MLAPSPHRHRPALDEHALTRLASALLAARSIWEGEARFDPVDRWPVRLLGDDDFEAWVIGWCPGQSLGLHDHGDSAGAIVVADGRLRETTVVDGAGGARVTSLTLARGQVQPVRPGAIHGVANLDAQPATSLHVYSPPLDHMRRFEPNGRVVETVGVERERPRFPAAVGSLLRLSSRT